MILNYLDELKLYLDKKELTPPDKEARKEIVNNIEDEIKNLLWGLVCIQCSGSFWSWWRLG